jgi:hypothetical protein
VKYPFLILVIIVFTTSLLGFPLPASAYLGPGAGLSAIGALLALFAAIAVAIFGFLWYPIKRLRRKKQAATKTNPSKNGEREE